jgi:hypothetical protein
VLNNPLKYTDPSGHIIEDACIVECALMYMTVLTSSPDFQTDMQFLAKDGADFQDKPSVGNGVAFGLALGSLAAPKIPNAGASKSAGKIVDKAIGWTGKIGEEHLSKIINGTKQVFNTSLGKRIPDMYNQESKTIHEAKTGYTSLTKFVHSQIQKDISLVKDNNTVQSSVWHFYTSPATGKSGASNPLQKALSAAGIKFLLH